MAATTGCGFATARGIQAIDDLGNGLPNGLQGAHCGARILPPSGGAGLEQGFESICLIPVRTRPKRGRERPDGPGCRLEALELREHLAQMSFDGIEAGQLGSGVLDADRQIPDRRFNRPEPVRIGPSRGLLKGRVHLQF